MFFDRTFLIYLSKESKNKTQFSIRERLDKAYIFLFEYHIIIYNIISIDKEIRLVHMLKT